MCDTFRLVANIGQTRILTHTNLSFYCDQYYTNIIVARKMIMEMAGERYVYIIAKTFMFRRKAATFLGYGNSVEL